MNPQLRVERNPRKSHVFHLCYATYSGIQTSLRKGSPHDNILVDKPLAKESVVAKTSRAHSKKNNCHTLNRNNVVESAYSNAPPSLYNAAPWRRAYTYKVQRCVWRCIRPTRADDPLLVAVRLAYLGRRPTKQRNYITSHQKHTETHPYAHTHVHAHTHSVTTEANNM